MFFHSFDFQGHTKVRKHRRYNRVMVQEHPTSISKVF